MFVGSRAEIGEWQKAFVEGDKSGLQSVLYSATIGLMDITNEWTKTKGLKGSVAEKQEYIVNGVTYRVDGKHIVPRPTEQEREIAKKKMQSPNFIFDITNCPLSESEIEKQIKDVYASTHTKFIKKIVVMKEKKIIRVYDK